MASNLTPLDPFRDIARFDPFNRFDDVFSDFGLMPRFGMAEAAPRICMDLSETDQAYTVKAEVAGARKEDIKVSIDGNQVSISADVKREKEQSDENMVRSERYYGQQFRSFTLPQEVDDKKAVAKYSDGVLELTLPKKAGTGAKQLAIQ
jgi:HSP20 family protein